MRSRRKIGTVPRDRRNYGRVMPGFCVWDWSVVPHLILDRECVRQDVRNTVKSVRNNMVRDGRGPCNRKGGECCQISLGSGDSGATGFFTKKVVTNEKRSRSVHTFSGAVQQNTQSNVQRIFSSS